MLGGERTSFRIAAAILTCIVSRLTRGHATVALSGDGGDEIFAGYLRLAAMAAAERVPQAVASLGNRIGGAIPHHSDFRHPSRRFSRFFAAAALPPAERMLEWVGIFSDPGFDIVVPELRSGIDRGELLRSFSEPWDEASPRSALAGALALNFETYLPEDLLVKADRCSMAHGLEVRAPFLDSDLMEFAATLPDRHRIGRVPGPKTLKWILRRAFQEVIPPEVTNRGKMGFGVPIPLWFRTHWRSFFEDRVLSPDAAVYQWLSRDTVEAMWRAHLREAADHGHRLWTLLTLETWLQRHT